MANINSKTRERFTAGLKKYKPIVKKALSQDINESDTVTIIVDMLQDIFGYDKYSEITSEFAIKKTFCDLALKINDEVKVLIEVKAAGLSLKENHIKQAVDYGSNSGIDWVILTNGTIWKVYKIIFAKPVSNELVYEFDLTAMSPKSEDDLLHLFMISKEGISKSAKTTLDNYFIQKELVNKYIISQILLSEEGLNFIKKALRKVSAESKATVEEISAILNNDIIKREVIEDDSMKDAKKKVSKALKKPTTKKNN